MDAQTQCHEPTDRLTFRLERPTDGEGGKERKKREEGSLLFRRLAAAWRELAHEAHFARPRENFPASSELPS